MTVDLRLLNLGFLVSILAWAPAHADSPLQGWWWSEDRDAIVELTLADDDLTGRIVWLEEPDYADDHDKAGKPLLDDENPDKEKRDRPILGLVILEDFEKHSDGEWRDGSVYDPNNGRTYRARLRLSDDGDELRLRGYIGRPIFGRSSHWTRVSDNLPEEEGRFFKTRGPEPEPPKEGATHPE